MVKSSTVRGVTWAFVGFTSGVIFSVVTYALRFGPGLGFTAVSSPDATEAPATTPEKASVAASEGAASLANTLPASEAESNKRPALAWDRVTLYFDRPDVRARLEQRKQMFLERLQQERGPEYERWFAELGLDADTSKQLVADILQVYRARREASDYAQQLLFAQSDLERRLAMKLGAGYPAYLEHEEDLRADSEADQILEFVRGDARGGLFADKLDQLQQIIIASDAYSARSKGSFDAPPLSELPWPARNAAAVRQAEQDQAALAVNARSSIAMARASEFSPAEIAALESYYQSELDAYERWIRGAGDPMGAELAKLEARLAARRNSSDSSPAEIQRLSLQVERLKSVIAASAQKR